MCDTFDTILLTKNNTINIIKINKKLNYKKINLKYIINNQNLNKGIGPIKIIHIYKNPQSEYFVYGWDEGNAGSENKVEMPGTISSILFFGDILILKIVKNKIQNLNIEEYEEFYKKAFGGFIDLDNTSGSGSSSEYIFDLKNNNDNDSDSDYNPLDTTSDEELYYSDSSYYDSDEEDD